MSKLERIVHDDSNGLDYILVGEIYLPLIAVAEEKRDIGFYGSLHRSYLKDYKGGLYSYLTVEQLQNGVVIKKGKKTYHKVML